MFDENSMFDGLLFVQSVCTELTLLYSQYLINTYWIYIYFYSQDKIILFSSALERERWA